MPLHLDPYHTESRKTKRLDTDKEVVFIPRTGGCSGANFNHNKVALSSLLIIIPFKAFLGLPSEYFHILFSFSRFFLSSSRF
jgi:hypothetical protein